MEFHPPAPPREPGEKSLVSRGQIFYISGRKSQRDPSESSNPPNNIAGNRH